MKSDSNDSEMGEALERAARRRDSSLNGYTAEIPQDRLSALLSLVGIPNPSERPQWESVATSALQQEILRRDDILSTSVLELPASVRRHLLGRIRDERGRTSQKNSQRTDQPVWWLLPVAACLLGGLAVLSLVNNTSRGVLVDKAIDSVVTDRDWSEKEEYPDQFTVDSQFEENLLTRMGLVERKEVDVSFRKLVVVDETLLEPRVFLSNSFHFAIGQDLSAMDTDGG